MSTEGHEEVEREWAPETDDPWWVSPKEMLACLPDREDDDPWPEEEYDFGDD